MNPHDLSASDLLIWGIVLHLIADWPMQNDWMTQNKDKRQRLGKIRGDGIMTAPSRDHDFSLWFIRHPAAYVHATIHGMFLAFIFGWIAIPLAITHLLIDTRRPVAWWSKHMKQTQPQDNLVMVETPDKKYVDVPLYDVGVEVRIWVDQVFHIVCIAVAALLVTL